MADRYTSRIALVMDAPVDDVGEVVLGARRNGDIDRAAPVGDEGAQAHQVHWGGRMHKGVVRQVTDERDGATLLRTETYIGSDGVTVGMQRHARLVQALARQCKGILAGIRDLSAIEDHDEAWMNRLAIGAVELEDAIVPKAEGEGTWWVRTHGAARFDVPDLELYGLARSQVEVAIQVLRHVHEQLLRKGLKGQLALPDGTPVYLVPVREAWGHVPFEWPGVGRAGQDRGPGLDGPRATLSVLHKPRLGRYRKDFEGVLDRLAASRSN